MPFTIDAPLLPEAITAAQAFLAQLPALTPSWLSLRRIYLHWSVEQWGCLDGQYNGEIDLEGGKWVMKITHNPLDNARALHPGDDYAAHTYHRNSQAFGLAITGMVGATTSDFGEEPINVHGLEFLCAGAAAVAQRYNIDTAGTINGEPTVMTHAEAAIADNYFPGDGDPNSRWDLARLAASDDLLTKTEAGVNAMKLRERIHAYKLQLTR